MAMGMGGGEGRLRLQIQGKGSPGIEYNWDVKLKPIEPGTTPDVKELCQKAGQQTIILNGRLTDGVA